MGADVSIPSYLIAAMVLSGAASEPNHAAQPAASNPWAGRSGEAEALADLANGRPVKLYTHVLGGERAGFRSPGLLYCDPDQNIGSKAAEAMFVSIPDANFSEGVIYTPAELSLSRSASVFARAYNLTMYHRHRGYIVSLCPKVELEKH